jgi:hypothetical protein
MEDDAGEPGVCEITVAHPPEESLPPPIANFYDRQRAVLLQQA